jgi:hypothetical protein
LIFLSSDSLSELAIQCSPLFQHKKSPLGAQPQKLYGVNCCKELNSLKTSEVVTQSSHAAAALWNFFI